MPLIPAAPAPQVRQAHASTHTAAARARGCAHLWPHTHAHMRTHTHTHTRARARARTHTLTRTRVRTRATSCATAETEIQTNPGPPPGAMRSSGVGRHRKRLTGSHYHGAPGSNCDTRPSQQWQQAGLVGAIGGAWVDGTRREWGRVVWRNREQVRGVRLRAGCGRPAAGSLVRAPVRGAHAAGCTTEPARQICVGGRSNATHHNPLLPAPQADTCCGPQVTRAHLQHSHQNRPQRCASGRGPP
jgi:hypothetical protein